MRKIFFLSFVSLVFLVFCLYYFVSSKAQNASKIEINKSEQSNSLEESFSKLISIAQEKGSVPVIVGFRFNFIPEGNLTESLKENQRADIKKNQDALLGKLKTFKPENIKQYETIPYLALTVDAKTLEFLRTLPEVTFIREDELHAPTLFESTQVVHAPQSWSLGYSGQGQVVAILDTGVDKNHPFLSGKVISEACYSTNAPQQLISSVCPGGVTATTATNSGLHCTFSAGCKHGTHVAGIAAGRLTSSSFYGVARDANLVAIQVFSRVDNAQSCLPPNDPAPCVRSWDSDYIAGLQRVLALKQGGMNIASANMSLGGGQYFFNCDADKPDVKAAIDNLRSVNVATVISSGNDGFTDSMGAPACISTAISVGSTGDGSNGATLDVVSTFTNGGASNSAPFLNLLAPGKWIQSSTPNGNYETWEGTSMAAPHVAGAWAILKQRIPNASVAQILNALSTTGQPITDSRNGIIKPRINIENALNTLPCSSQIAIGQTINNSLTTSDCILPPNPPPRYIDVYVFEGTAGQQIAISMNSSFDTYLFLVNSSNQVIAQDNNGGGGTNSRIPTTSGFFTLPSTGTYAIYATSNPTGATGSYTINLSGICNSSAIASGQTVDGRLQNLDCVLNDGSYYDAYTFNGAAGQQIYITLNSAQFNAYLVLFQGNYPTGTLLAQDDNGGGGTNARIPANSGFFTLPSTGTYTILANSFAAGESGDYQLFLGTSVVATTHKPFDFDGDGKTDISIFRPAPGEWWYLRSSDGGNRAAQFGASTDKITPGDFTGDGKTDIALWRPSTGFWYILRSEDSSFFSFPFGTSGDMPAPADYDGDGKTDSAVFRPSTGTWFISNSGGSGTSIVNFGSNGDKPVTADYDGDAKTDIAIFRPSDGSWWYLRSSDGQFRVFRFGVSTDKPVQGDYTGDSKADIAVFRPSTGEWFIQRSEDNSFFSFPFGANGDVPVPGDYDGDGKFDAGVFRPSNSTWFVNRTTSGLLIVNFGAAGDLPVPSAFVP